MDKAKVENLSKLVDYQAGAIVSKTIINEKTGTITIFAFDKGQYLSEHTAPFDAVVYVADGVGEVTIKGEAHQLQAGELIIMPADQPHSVQANERFKMLLIMIKK